MNDDLEIASIGWTTFFVQSFKENNEFGIAAPYDAGHKGRVFTQAFVSRKHYEIFGRLYPMDIKVYSCYIPMIFNVRMIGLPIS